MSKKFELLIKEYIKDKDYEISDIKNTNHWNVKRLYDKKEEKKYVIKGILHIDNDKDFSKTKMDNAYKKEVLLLSNLPKWWGLELKDNFVRGNFRFIILSEINSCKWSMYDGNKKIDKKIASSIYKQLSWLHKKKIAHNDMELKNIIFDCDKNKAVIIDFEKSIKNATKKQMNLDYMKVIDGFKQNDNTRNIGNILEKLIMKNKRTRKNKNKKSNKSKSFSHHR